jgi:phage tail tape-measure protein
MGPDGPPGKELCGTGRRRGGERSGSKETKSRVAPGEETVMKKSETETHTSREKKEKTEHVEREAGGGVAGAIAGAAMGAVAGPPGLVV